MSDYPIPAGLDSFSLCPTPGCEMRVWSSPRVNFPCRDHGGPPGLLQFREADPFGNPRASAASSPPRLAPSLETV